MVKQHEKYAKLEATNEQLVKELEEKKELVKTLYAKHQLEKQVNFLCELPKEFRSFKNCLYDPLYKYVVGLSSGSGCT